MSDEKEKTASETIFPAGSTEAKCKDALNKTYLFDRPENVERLLKGLYAICILLVLADFVLHRHTSFGWEEIPAFYAIYGFTACVVLVVIAKKMRNIVMRKEDYYDE